MDDEIETLLVEVRAETSGFAVDVQSIRSTLDTSLVDGFSRAGDVLERGLQSAIRSGKLGFDDLKRTALSALSEIASQAIQGGLGSIFGGSAASGASSGLAGLFSSSITSLLGLPGRATGGPVAPGSAYLVGERGPEVFLPTSSGRIETLGNSGSGRDVRVAINLAAQQGSDQPAMLRRSSRQVASAIRRALSEA